MYFSFDFRQRNRTAAMNISLRYSMIFLKFSSLLDPGCQGEISRGLCPRAELEPGDCGVTRTLSGSVVRRSTDADDLKDS